MGDAETAPRTDGDTEHLDDRLLDRFLATQPEEYRNKTLQEGTVVAIAHAFQEVGSDGKPTGVMRAVQCNASGCRNIDYTNELSRAEYEKLAIPYTETQELLADPAKLDRLLAYPMYGNVPSGASLALSPANGLSLTLSIVKYPMDGSKHKYRFNTYWDWSSCSTCCRGKWAPGNGFGNAFCSPGSANPDFAGSSGEDAESQDMTDLEWTRGWVPYSSGGNSGGGNWLANDRYDNYAYDIWEEDENGGTATYKFWDCYNWTDWPFVGRNCGGTHIKAAGYPNGLWAPSWNDHGWSDKYVYLYNLPSEDTSVYYRYWHTYGNQSYSLGLSLDGIGVDISSTSGQWMVYVPLSWSRSSY